MEGETVEAFQKFLDFVAGIVPRDWVIMADATAKDLRLGVAYWAWQVGLSGRLIINSIDYKSTVDELVHYRDFGGVAGLVAAAFDVDPNNKVKVADSIMARLREAGLGGIPTLIDLSVLDVPDMAATAALIPSFKSRIAGNYLVGFAPANVVPTWKKVDAVLRSLKERGVVDDYAQFVKTSMRASMAVVSAMFPYIDFILFGPLRESTIITTNVAAVLTGDFKAVEWRDDSREPAVSPIVRLPRPFSGMIDDLKAALNEAEANIDNGKIIAKQELPGLDDLKSKFSVAVGDLEDDSVELAKQLLERGGVSPLELIELMKKGMDVVGDRYERGEYFVSELVMAGGEIGEGVVKLIEPFFKENKSAERVKVVIGTVEGGDIHSIGKNIVKMMLMANGYDVIDLGVDVPPAEKFVEEAIKENAQVIGLSSLLSTSAINMRKVLELLDKRGLRGKIKVVIGGAAVTEEYAKKIGADGYAKNAVETVRLLDKWFKGQ